MRCQLKLRDVTRAYIWRKPADIFKRSIFAYCPLPPCRYTNVTGIASLIRIP
jgi:hypothetical protein